MTHARSVIAAAMLLLVAGLASGQRLDTALSDGWVADEPGSEGGRLPFCAAPDPCTYPPDANGLGPDREGAPGLVLAVMWESRVPQVGGVYASATLAGLGASADVLQGFGRWTAWYGAFHDLDGDGRIDDAVDDAVGVSTTDGCGLAPPCAGADEWTPAPAATVVAYVTPGDFNGRADWFNRRHADDPRAPDLVFQAEPGGRYFAASSGFEYVVVDNGLLETTVLEAFSAPDVAFDGARTHVPGAASLVEVDVHTSIDPSVEALYQASVVGPLRTWGCDVDFTAIAGACPAASERVVAAADAAVARALEDAGLSGALRPVTDAADAARAAVGDAGEGRRPRTDPIVGPLDDRTSPPWPAETDGVDWSEPHLFLDQRLVAATNSRSMVTAHTSSTSMSSVALGDGAYRPFAQTELHARLGVWKDANGDGVIGRWQEDGAQQVPGVGTVATDDDGCPDRYDCGNVDDPNSYDAAASGGEYLPLCGTRHPARPNAQGAYVATVTSSTGTWGRGVYVLTDRVDAKDPGADPLRDDGRAPYDPYDDLVLDAADGDIASVVLRGPITVHMGCNDNSGFYAGYERLFFLDGTNRGYDVHTSATVTAEFAVQGGMRSETRADDDVYAAFAT